MKSNRSLELSIRVEKQMKEGLLGVMGEYFPEERIRRYQEEEGVKRRDRLYSLSSTVQTMIATAVQIDKSLEQSVLLFRDVLKSQTKTILDQAEQEKKWVIDDRKRRGRPRKNIQKIPIAKSKLKDISPSTSSYTTARQRVPRELMEILFKEINAIKGSEITKDYHWHNRDVFVTDGTYVQLQDTPEIRKKYRCGRSESGTSYPQALLSGVIHQGAGIIHEYRLSGRDTSELDHVMGLMQSLPKGSILLGDDLYNAYAVFVDARTHGIDILVPSKRVRNYVTQKVIGPGDEIIMVKAAESSLKKIRCRAQVPKEPIPKTLLLRRISYTDPQYPKSPFVLMTTLLDETIDKADIVALYASRWDIEISIREIKTIMHINILRSKTDDMIHKELAASLIAYNLIRKIILKAVDSTAFSPKADLLYEIYSVDQTLLVDKRGRVFSQISSGRPPKS